MLISESYNYTLYLNSDQLSTSIIDPYSANGSITNTINGNQLVVVGLADPDYTYHLTITKLAKGGIEFNTGFDLDVLRLLEYSLNFTHRALEGEGWIDLLPNGSWGGVGRQITSHEANLSIAQSTFLAERVVAFSYLIPTMVGELTASFRQPSGAAVKNLLTETFPGDLWLVLLLFGFLVLATIKVVAAITARFELEYESPSSEDPEQESEPEQDSHSKSDSNDSVFFTEAFFWVLVSFCQRNLVGSPQTTPMRIIYISLVITSVVSYVAFSAALVSNLAVELLPIRSFSDLITSPLQVYGDSSVPYSHGYVQTMLKQRGEIQKSSKKQGNVTSSSNYLGVHEGLKNVLGGSAIYITFKDAITSVEKVMGLSDRYVCANIYQFKIPGSSFPAGMVLPKGSPLRQVFNPKIVSLHQTGLLKRTTKKWNIEVFPSCLRQSTTKREQHVRDSLTLRDVYTAFLILILGHLFGIILICLEKLVAFLILFNGVAISNCQFAPRKY